MVEAFYKHLSLYVGWFNIVASLIAPTFFMYVALYRYGGLQFDWNDSRSKSVIGVSIGFTIWIILSILLVHGIKKNRPKFLSLWIASAYLVLIIANSAGIAFMCTSNSWYEAEWKILTLSPGIFVSVTLLFFTIPVRKLYFQMVESKKCLKKEVNIPDEVKITVDDKRYMPIFENC